jgi:colanic acid biosynthesis glycosyl transferase WcaI
LQILILSLSFCPDHSGISVYSSDFAFYAAGQGHGVEVITGYPFYPKWKKRKEDKWKLFSTENRDGVKILRGYIYVPEKPTTFKRVIQEFSYLFSALFNYVRAKKPDVIIAFTTPITLGYLTSFFKKVSGNKLLINVQDFQMEAARSLDMTNRNFLFSLLASFEKKSYENANLVSSISQSMVNLLINNKNLPANKVYLWPNWIDLDKYILDNSRKGNFRKINNLPENKTIVAYAGNIGLKQGLEIMVDMANAFKLNESIQFYIIGNGAGIEFLKEYASKFDLSNLLFLPLLNPEQYLDFLTDLDVFFLSQKKTDFDIYFPSKLLGLMATKKLLLLSADKDSELYKTIKQNNIGLVSEYGDIDSLVGLLKQAIDDKSFAEKVSDAAEKYVKNFDRSYVLDNVLQKITNL